MAARPFGNCVVCGNRVAGLRRGMCNKHYLKWWKYGDPTTIVKVRARNTCSVEGCPGGARVTRGMCGKHYTRWLKHGDPLIVASRQKSRCSIDGCGDWVLARTWCLRHYTRWRTKGDPSYRLEGQVFDGRRICPGCSADKLLSEYGVGRSYCRTCTRDITRRWRTRNPSYVPPPRDPAKSRFWTSRWRANNPDKVRSYCAARRARRSAATTERFSVREIFIRDNWMCHLCEEPIDQTISYPDPMSASLDHVVPLVRGGAHSRENCRASHLVCNLRKSARTAVA